MNETATSRAEAPASEPLLSARQVTMQFGGLTALGVNICIMGLPALLCGLFFRRFFHNDRLRPWAAFACGFSAILLSALLCALALALSGDAFTVAAWTIFSAHIPIMFIEGFLTMVTVSYLARALPEMLSECQKAPESSAEARAPKEPRRAPAGDAPLALRGSPSGVMRESSHGI